MRWALERFRPDIMLSTSFGAQSAVSLHLVTQQWPEIPVVLVDTGYLFPETYRFADQLTERLKLNLKVYRARVSPAWQEARWGKLWEQGVEGIDALQPVQQGRADAAGDARTRRARLDHAACAVSRRNRATGIGVLALQNGMVKIQPIIDWTDRRFTST